MSIEIKQMQVTASVGEEEKKETEEEKDSCAREKELESVKQPILNDCRELFLELQDWEKER